MSIAHSPDAQGNVASVHVGSLVLADDLAQLVESELDQDRCEIEAAHLYPAPHRLQQEVDSLSNLQISAELSAWASRYGEVGARNPYLWTWCRRGVEITTLPCVDQSLVDAICDTKVLSVMLDVLLDDIADQGGDLMFLEALIETVQDLKAGNWQSFSRDQQRYAEFTWELAQEVHTRLQLLPNHQKYHDLLAFDYRQLFNTMRYSHLLNRFPDMLNLAEHDLYLPHNMHMIVSSTMDLMASSGFETTELGRVREAIWHAQYMGRIGNLVTTWERELLEGDFTSGVFVRAFACGDVTLDQLKHGDPERVKSLIRSRGHEVYFLKRWHAHRGILVDLTPGIRSFDLGELIAGLDRLICLHLASRGRK